MSGRPELLVFDCDPGCDDALAIALVVRANAYKRIDVLTVAGNVGVHLTTANAVRIIDILRKDGITGDTVIRVFKGCRKSLVGGELPASNVHGRDGMGDVPASFVQADSSTIVDKNLGAVGRILELVQSADPFDLLCTGPLTNVATALTLMDEDGQDNFWSLARHVVCMGGQFQVAGNVTPAAEFNIFHDPVAAQIVLDSWRETNERRKKQSKDPLPQTCFVPLDATEKVVLELSDKIIPAPSTDLGRFLRSALITYGRFHAIACRNPNMKEPAYEDRDKEVFKDQLVGGSGVKYWRPFCYVHDALAAWVLLHGLPPIGRVCPVFNWQTMEIRVDTSRGEARGHIFDVEQHAQPFSSKVAEIGTPVYWLKEITDELSPDSKCLNGKRILVGELMGLFSDHTLLGQIAKPESVR